MSGPTRSGRGWWPRAAVRGRPAAPPRRPTGRRSSPAAGPANRVWPRSPSRGSGGPGAAVARRSRPLVGRQANEVRAAELGDRLDSSGLGRGIVDHDAAHPLDRGQQALQLGGPVPNGDDQRDVVSAERRPSRARKEGARRGQSPRQQLGGTPAADRLAAAPAGHDVLGPRRDAPQPQRAAAHQHCPTVEGHCGRVDGEGERAGQRCALAGGGPVHSGGNGDIVPGGARHRAILAADPPG